MYICIPIRNNMAFKDTYKMASELLTKLEKRGTYDTDYYGAKKTIIDLLERSSKSEEVEAKFSKWLKSHSTLDLKEIVPSDKLQDFNVMSLLDTLIIKK